MDGYSIIIACYNEGSFLKKTIDGIIETAGHPFFEIIIVNDGSKRDDFLFLKEKKYKEKPITLIATKHKGIDAARNRGAQESRYDTLIFVDAHMSFTKDWLLKVDILFKRNSFLSFLGLSCENILPNTPRNSSYFHVYTPLNITLEQHIFLDIKKTRKQLLKVPIINGANLIIKKAVFIKLGGFWEIHTNWQDSFFSMLAYYYGIDCYIAPNITIYHHLVQSNQHIETAHQTYQEQSLRACYLLYPTGVFKDCLGTYCDKNPYFLNSPAYRNFLKDQKNLDNIRKTIHQSQVRGYTEFVEEHWKFLPAFQLYEYQLGQKYIFKDNKKAQKHFLKANTVSYLGNTKKKVQFKKHIRQLLRLISQLT